LSEDTAIKFQIDIKALIFLSLVIYLAPLDFVAAYFFAVIFHETGHLLCLYIFQKRIYSMNLELTGLVIEHEGALTAFESLLCAAAGPALGLLYAYVASFISSFVLPDFFSLSAGLSLALSFFNALPVSPLDGASMLKSLCQLLKINNPSKALFISGISICTGLFILGIYLLRFGMGYGLIGMAVVLMLSTLFEEGIVKKGDLR